MGKTLGKSLSSMVGRSTTMALALVDAAEVAASGVVMMQLVEAFGVVVGAT